MFTLLAKSISLKPLRWCYFWMLLQRPASHVPVWRKWKLADGIKVKLWLKSPQGNWWGKNIWSQFKSWQHFYSVISDFENGSQPHCKSINGGFIYSSVFKVSQLSYSNRLDMWQATENQKTASFSTAYMRLYKIFLPSYFTFIILENVPHLIIDFRIE